MFRHLVTLIAAAALIGGVAAENAFAKKGPKFKGPKATKHLEKKALKGKGLGIGGGNIFGSLERNLIRNFLGSPAGKKFKAKKFKHKSLPPASPSSSTVTVSYRLACAGTICHLASAVACRACRRGRPASSSATTCC